MRFLSLLIILFIIGCSNSEDTLAGFKSEEWKTDIWGCLGNRANLIDGLMEKKESLKGHDTDYLVKYLGNPDEKNIVNRQQKYFRYYLSSVVHCNDSINAFIQLRINSVGLIDEIISVE